ncbi:hypothetical protein ACWF9B_00260 [Streptomyces sp. NPDC055089]
MNEAFTAEAAQLVDSLVASGGGLVSYELGAPGQEIALKAGVQLASEGGRSLTVVDFQHLLPQVQDTITELAPDLPCTLLPLGRAVEHPERFTGGILVLRSGLLHDADIRKALLALAGTADSVIVAARADVDQSVLNTLPGPRFVASAELMQRPGRVDRTPGIDMHYEVVANVDPLAGLKERKERFIRQLMQGTPVGSGLGKLEEIPETIFESSTPPSNPQEQDGAAPRPDALDSGLPGPPPMEQREGRVELAAQVGEFQREAAEDGGGHRHHRGEPDCLALGVESVEQGADVSRAKGQPRAQAPTCRPEPSSTHGAGSTN